jgi:hypothetical protein
MSMTRVLRQCSTPARKWFHWKVNSKCTSCPQPKEELL